MYSFDFVVLICSLEIEYLKGKIYDFKSLSRISPKKLDHRNNSYFHLHFDNFTDNKYSNIGKHKCKSREKWLLYH